MKSQFHVLALDLHDNFFDNFLVILTVFPYGLFYKPIWIPLGQVTGYSFVCALLRGPSPTPMRERFKNPYCHERDVLPDPCPKKFTTLSRLSSPKPPPPLKM